MLNIVMIIAFILGALIMLVVAAVFVFALVGAIRVRSIWEIIFSACAAICVIAGSVLIIFNLNLPIFGLEKPGVFLEALVVLFLILFGLKIFFGLEKPLQKLLRKKYRSEGDGHDEDESRFDLSIFILILVFLLSLGTALVMISANKVIGL